MKTMTKYQRGYQDALEGKQPRPPFFGAGEYMQGYTVGCYDSVAIKDAAEQGIYIGTITRTVNGVPR